MEDKRNAYGMLMGKSEGKIQLGRPRRRWVDNIEKGLRETGWGVIDWTNTVQDRDWYIAL
jgi:hypothetical protein